MSDQTAAATDATKPPVIVKHPTQFKHVYLVDVDNNGLLKEIAVVKEDTTGTLVYIDIALLDNIDKGRIKKLVMSPHADKYALWELMDMERLSNGYNALTYFHQMVKTKQAPGYANTALGGGLAMVRADSGVAVGQGFTNTTGATL